MNNASKTAFLAIVSFATISSVEAAHYRIIDNNVDQTIFLTEWQSGADFDLSTVTAPELNLVYVIEARSTVSGEVYAKSYSDGLYANIKLELVPDTDSDGIPDYWETLYALDPADPSDAPLDLETPPDGLTNLEEYLYQTDPTLASTDGDALPDGYEVDHLLDPNDSQDQYVDYDNDGLSAWLEFLGNQEGLGLSDLPEYELPVDLGSHSGGFIFPKAINNYGEVVGWYGNSAGTVSHAFFWSADDPVLKTLSINTGMSRAKALYINASGKIAGQAYDEVDVWDDDDGEWYTYTYYHSFYWENADAPASLINPPANLFLYNDPLLRPYRPKFLNDLGELYLLLDWSWGRDRGDLYKWDGASYEDKGFFAPPHYQEKFEVVLNQGGDTFFSVPTSDYKGNPPELKIRLNGESTWYVHRYEDQLGATSQAVTYAANDNRNATGQVNGRPYLFDAGTMRFLDVAGPTEYGQGVGINNLNTVVGDSEAVDGLLSATMWTRNSPALDLNTFLANGTDWDLVSATDINDHGDIVGYGYRESIGQYRGFYLEAISQDDDGDGLSNDWESFWSYILSGSVGNISVYGDADADGLSNYTEYLLGTYLNESNAEETLPSSQASTYDADVIIVLDDRVFEVKQLTDSITLRKHHIR